MRILFVSDTSATASGGIETHINRLGDSLVTSSGDTQVQHLLAESIRYLLFFGKSIVGRRRLIQEIRRAEPQVVHIHGFASFFVALAISVCSQLRLPIVYTPHYHPFSTLRLPMLGSLFFQVFLRRQLAKVDQLIALTEEEKVFFQKYIAANKIDVLPNGIDRMEFVENKADRTWGQLLFVGRNVPNKRIDFLLGQKDFFLRHQLKVVLVSDINRESDEVFEILKHIPFQTLKKLYREAGALVLPSKYEAFGIVVLEALASGMPVVISDRVQIKEYLQQEESVFVFEYDDEQSFQSQVVAVLAKRGSLQFPDLTSYDWSAIAEKLQKIYLRVQ